jgi:hypothetical protein
MSDSSFETAWFLDSAVASIKRPGKTGQADRLEYYEMAGSEPAMPAR